MKPRVCDSGDSDDDASDDDSDQKRAPPKPEARTRSGPNSVIGKVVDVRLAAGKSFLGTVVNVARKGDDNVWIVADDTTGVTSNHNPKFCSLAKDIVQKTPIGLRGRDLGKFITDRGNLLFPSNLECDKTVGPAIAGTPISVLHSAEAGFNGYGTMGDILSSELSILYSEYPVHSTTDLPNIGTGDLLYIPGTATAAAKMSKTAARSGVTCEVTSQIFEAVGNLVPCS